MLLFQTNLETYLEQTFSNIIFKDDGETNEYLSSKIFVFIQWKNVLVSIKILSI